ncbi:accessory Sec system glycosyltransferase GtfA [Ligilactobacillus equi]|uniref:accessory Sec system glycosyltransferase GtfA n=1 Tax=Ligilactobacillus equi TaxID=137357 RepID=UPI002ED58AE9
MTVYNFNLGIGWASSGVEYAQAYRAEAFRQEGIPARFIYTDLILYENLIHMTENIGIKAEEVIWLYTWFTDLKPSPTTFTLEDLLATLADKPVRQTRDGKVVRLYFEDSKRYATVYLKNETEDYVERVEYVDNNLLIRKDYYTYTRAFSEYYAPKDNAAHAYQRRFYNEDGSMAYEEICDEKGDSTFIFKDKIIYSKEELITLFVQSLNLTADDIVILDRETGQGQQVFEQHRPAKLGVVIHAEHYSENHVSDDYILWNNYYDYQFTNSDEVDFFIAATPVQQKIVQEQLKKYNGRDAKIYNIAVGNLDQLRRPQKKRKPYSLVSVSRLASEKHLNWVVEAVVKAKKTLPELTLDIYGKGGEEETLKKLITQLGAQDYIHLKGHQDVTEIYTQYQVYISGSTSEGFGLSLLEAIGSGLPIIGFDVPYGNQTFVDEGKNGYLVESNANTQSKQRVQDLSERIVTLFTKDDIAAFQEHSYQKASEYLTANISRKWKQLVEEQVK